MTFLTGWLNPPDLSIPPSRVRPNARRRKSSASPKPRENMALCKCGGPRMNEKNRRCGKCCYAQWKKRTDGDPEARRKERRRNYLKSRESTKCVENNKARCRRWREQQKARKAAA